MMDMEYIVQHTKEMQVICQKSVSCLILLFEPFAVIAHILLKIRLKMFFCGEIKKI